MKNWYLYIVLNMHICPWGMMKCSIWAFLWLNMIIIIAYTASIYPLQSIETGQVVMLVPHGYQPKENDYSLDVANMQVPYLKLRVQPYSCSRLWKWNLPKVSDPFQESNLGLITCPINMLKILWDINDLEIFTSF